VIFSLSLFSEDPIFWISVGEIYVFLTREFRGQKEAQLLDGPLE
jgi:hypothetical protein